jgi:hypothetical protein
MNWSPWASSSTEVHSMATGRPTQVEADINSGAYELYLQRGCEPGRELEDWLRAEAGTDASENSHARNVKAFAGREIARRVHAGGDAHRISCVLF